MGYQCDQGIDFASELAPALNVHINNVGDPFIRGHMTITSKAAEQAVLEHFARLWHATPRDLNVSNIDQANPESYWGYVLTMGSTEGALYALWNARDYLSGMPRYIHHLEQEGLLPEEEVARKFQALQLARKVQKNAYTPVIFFSADTHYSLLKHCRILGIRTFFEVAQEYYPGQCPLGGRWPQEVPSEGDDMGPGSIDIPKLTTLVEFFASRGYPIICVFNLGSTFKGAYDDVGRAGEALMPIFEKYGLLERKIHFDPLHPERVDIRTGYWIHVDGALGAAYVPYLRMAYEEGRIEKCPPLFDFRLPFVHSINVSGHKYIGSPLPCGVYLTKVKYEIRPPSDPAYIGTPDTTFAGSRAGFSALLLWSSLSRRSKREEIETVIRLQELAKYTTNRLNEISELIGEDLWVARSELSLAIRFRQPNDVIVQKYTLSCTSLYARISTTQVVQRNYSHVYIMRHVTKELLERFFEDLLEPGAFPPQTYEPSTTLVMN